MKIGVPDKFSIQAGAELGQAQPNLGLRYRQALKAVVPK